MKKASQKSVASSRKCKSFIRPITKEQVEIAIRNLLGDEATDFAIFERTFNMLNWKDRLSYPHLTQEQYRRQVIANQAEKLYKLLHLDEKQEANYNHVAYEIDALIQPLGRPSTTLAALITEVLNKEILGIGNNHY